MSKRKPPQMATTSVRPAPVRSSPAETGTPKKSKVTAIKRIEDRIDYMTVQNARASAAKRGEKPMAWEEFKKKLG
jgi:hypothetical protein